MRPRNIRHHLWRIFLTVAKRSRLKLRATRTRWHWLSELEVHSGGDASESSHRYAKSSWNAAPKPPWQRVLHLVRRLHSLISTDSSAVTPRSVNAFGSRLLQVTIASTIRTQNRTKSTEFHMFHASYFPLQTPYAIQTLPCLVTNAKCDIMLRFARCKIWCCIIINNLFTGHPIEWLLKAAARHSHFVLLGHIGHLLI